MLHVMVAGPLMASRFSRSIKVKAKLDVIFLNRIKVDVQESPNAIQY
jgi:hypothetical protein